jgi:hypothetical protein
VQRGKRAEHRNTIEDKNRRTKKAQGDASRKTLMQAEQSSVAEQ